MWMKMWKKNALKNWKKHCKKLKYPKTLIEASILKAKENEEIILFTATCDPNNPNIFPIIKQSFNNFQYFKTKKKKNVNSMSQASNLGRLLCRFIWLKKSSRRSYIERCSRKLCKIHWNTSGTEFLLTQ